MPPIYNKRNTKNNIWQHSPIKRPIGTQNTYTYLDGLRQKESIEVKNQLTKNITKREEPKGKKTMKERERERERER